MYTLIPAQLGLATAVAPARQSVFRGLTTEMWIDGKAPALLQAAIEQSLALRPFIANKIGKVSIAKNYTQYGSDDEFRYKYMKLNRIVVPFQQEKKLTENIRSFYHLPTDWIHLRPHTRLGDALVLAIQRFASRGFGGFFGLSVSAGVAHYFANRVLAEQTLDPVKAGLQKHLLECATNLVGLVGEPMVGRAYFQNHIELLNHLLTKLAIGRLQTTELTQDALCKTPLLPTAKMASQQLQNMVSVGMTGPGWVRLWMRTSLPGVHELQIFGGSGGARATKVSIQPGPQDQTGALTYPRSSGDKPLEPLTKYRYRVVRASDGTPVGEGSFETPPARDSDTPEKVVIALMSCHQPFSSNGSLDPVSAKMLRLMPKILEANNVKFVLFCGDQIYADEPGNLSLLSNRFLIRQACPGKKSIFDCNEAEVRRAYAMRYRTSWSMVPIRKMFANYPCYPALDDHEITDDWGTLKAHSGANYRNIARGARLAFLDYQASRILPPTAVAPTSFHYHFSYGNIGIFVMDIRSARRGGDPRNPLFDDVQLNDLRQFLRDNAHKKVLLIVSSVPVVHLAAWLTWVGVKVINPIGELVTNSEVDFPDQWSHRDNKPSLDAFLGLMHQHQQANPEQRVAIVSGDVHIGNAFGIKWQGGRKPRLYQFTSSALTMRLSRFQAKLSEWGPPSVAKIDCPATRNTGPCSANVHLLPPEAGGGSQNPYSGLNLGLIEIRRFGDVSNLKFKLVGADPATERPVTYFESQWLS